jgi:hypothetical protein
VGRETKMIKPVRESKRFQVLLLVYQRSPEPLHLSHCKYAVTARKLGDSTHQHRFFIYSFNNSCAECFSLLSKFIITWYTSFVKYCRKY